MLSMASQKSMVNVGLRTNGYEGEPRSLDRTSALQIAKHLNSIICMLIEFDSIIDEREFDIWREWPLDLKRRDHGKIPKETLRKN